MPLVASETAAACDMNSCDQCVRQCMRNPPHDLSKCFAQCNQQFQCSGHCGHGFAEKASDDVVDNDVIVDTSNVNILPVIDNVEPNICDTGNCERCVGLCMSQPPHIFSQCIAACNAQWGCTMFCGHGYK